MYIKQRAGYVEVRRPPGDGRWRNRPTSVQPSKGYADAEQEKQADLEALFGKVIRKHTDRLRVDSRVPEGLSTEFIQSIESYQRTAPALLAKAAQQAAQTHRNSPGLGLSDFNGALLTQTDRLHNIETVYHRNFQQYLTILGQREEEDYLFISEKGDNTCEHCESYHGRLFKKKTLAQGGVIPPLHPNCRCSLVALDRMGAWQYNSPNREEMLQRLQLALDALGGGGIFILDPRFTSLGVSPDALTRLELPVEMTILGLDPKLQGVYRALFSLVEEMGSNAAETLTQLGEDAATTFRNILYSSIVLLDAFFQRGQQLWIDAGEMMAEHPLLAMVMAGDATFFGLASAVLSEVRHRASVFYDEPGLLTGFNLLTLGLGDALLGAFQPEELWSPAHLADILGAMGILSLFGLSGSTLGRNFSSADEFARSALDELTRGTGSGLTRSQIDDILGTSKGQRPDPSTYLSSSYINSHLSQFRGGVTKIYAQAPSGRAGPASGTYVFPSSMVDDLVKKAEGNVSKLEELLGLSPGHLGTQPVRIDISNPTGLRMPSGNERGANAQWLPGGYTSGGIAEAVIDPPSSGQYDVTPIW